MITVHLFEDQFGLYGFRCEGHAGYAREEQDDVICAAITAIAATTVTGLEDILKVELSYDFHSGNIECMVEEREEQQEQIHLLLQVFEIGCRQIEYSYGSEYVSVLDSEKIGGTNNV